MNKQSAFNTLNKFANARVQLIQGLIDAGYPTAEDARNVVVEWACAKTGCTFKFAESSGKAMLDSKHPKYEAAKTTVRDVMNNLEGTTRREKAASSGHSKPTKTRVSAEERAAFEAFLAACGDSGRALTVFKALTK